MIEMKEQLEKLAATGKITEANLEALLTLAEAGFCSHRSWGVGKIVKLDPLRERIIIDFEGKPGHSMDITFAAETLRPIESNHILARRITDLETLQNLAQEKPLELIKLLMESFSNKATNDQIQSALVPAIVAEEDWKKWWSALRAQMKKCGNYVIPSRKVEPILYQPAINSLQQRYLNDFNQTKVFKTRLTLLSKILQNLAELENPRALAEEIIPELNKEIHIHQEVNPSLALEAIFLRDELKRDLKIESEEEITPQVIWSLNPNSDKNNGVKILELLPPSIHKKAIISFKDTYPDTWANLFLENLNNISSKFCEEVVDLLLSNGYTEKIREILRTLISQHQASSELLHWFIKTRPEAFEEFMNVSTLRAMLAAIERDQFNNIRSCKLRDHLLSEKTIISDMIELSDIEEVKDITRALQFSPAFEDMDKRSILMRIVKLFPAVQSLISGDQGGKQDEGLVVSWESLERKKQEYADLVHNRIPANTKEIAIARSYGDLRENHEFKAAREQQKLLHKLKAEMEMDLDRCRGTDFKDAATDVVGIGTRVTLKDIKTNTNTDYIILGAWDFDDQKNIVSYLSPIAQAMLNKKQGEQVTFNNKDFIVETISKAIE